MSVENENPEEDPVILDILSSIKSIINEDDEPEEVKVVADPVPKAKSVGDDPLAGIDFEQGLDLDPEPVQPIPVPVPMPMLANDLEDSIISSATANMGTQQFVKLNNMIRMGNSNATLSDIVRSLLRPMLREWFDENLPTMVEQKVEYEIKRLVNRVDDRSS